jgi:hypothetical protein
MGERAEDPQSEALRTFMLLTSMRADWGGALIVACGLGRGGAALSVAGSIAGAGCLVIDERAEVCRAASRQGACDFVVNTVDEALRVLKNEIRQRRPVSVGLTSEMTTALEELLERGVQPELFTAFGREVGVGGVETGTRDRAARAFAALGTLVVDFDGTLAGVDGVVDASERLEGLRRDRGLGLEAFTFASAEELRAFDARLLEVIPVTDPRQRWYAGAPRFFHRERPYRRVVSFTPGEREEVTGAQK